MRVFRNRWKGEKRGMGRRPQAHDQGLHWRHVRNVDEKGKKGAKIFRDEASSGNFFSQEGTAQNELWGSSIRRPQQSIGRDVRFGQECELQQGGECGHTASSFLELTRANATDKTRSGRLRGGGKIQDIQGSNNCL